MNIKKLALIVRWPLKTLKLPQHVRNWRCRSQKWRRLTLCEEFKMKNIDFKHKKIVKKGVHLKTWQLHLDNWFKWRNLWILNETKWDCDGGKQKPKFKLLVKNYAVYAHFTWFLYTIVTKIVRNSDFWEMDTQIIGFPCLMYIFHKCITFKFRIQRTYHVKIT